MSRSSNPPLPIRDPWWMLLSFAGVVYVVGVHLLPAWTFEQPLIENLTNQLPTLANGFSLLLVGLAGLAGIQSFVLRAARRKLLAKNTHLDSIRALSWHQFEHLVGEAFRQQGYQVSEQGGAGADEGIDLVLHRLGQKTVVQCKHWQSGKVGVSVIREHRGVMSAQGTDQGIVVCTGRFTQPAMDFATANGVRLIDGAALAKLINTEKSVISHTPIESQTGCPTCGSAMVERQARKGTRAGSRFLGCSSFPGCRGTRPLTQDSQGRVGR